jgi:hypothetical protein
MTDKELLELAAKATGDFYQHPKHKIPENLPVVFYLNEKRWNPLTDDADALRLAVKLKLCFGPNFEGDLAVCFGDDGRNITEAYEADSYAATRRAITRAAAEIGKAMKS